MAARNTPANRPGQGLEAKREAVVAAFVNLINQVPDADEGDITDLLGPILAAKTWEELNTADALPSSLTMIGHEARIDRVAKKVSEKDTLTGYYLLCEGIDLTTGYVGRFTMGGAQAVAVVSQLHVLRRLPAKVRFDAVDTGNGGNQAINCKVLEIYENAVIDA